MKCDPPRLCCKKTKRNEHSTRISNLETARFAVLCGCLAFSGTLWHSLALSDTLWHSLAFSGILPAVLCHSPNTRQIVRRKCELSVVYRWTVAACLLVRCRVGLYHLLCYHVVPSFRSTIPFDYSGGTMAPTAWSMERPLRNAPSLLHFVMVRRNSCAISGVCGTALIDCQQSADPTE